MLQMPDESPIPNKGRDPLKIDLSFIHFCMLADLHVYLELFVYLESHFLLWLMIYACIIYSKDACNKTL